MCTIRCYVVVLLIAGYVELAHASSRQVNLECDENHEVVDHGSKGGGEESVVELEIPSRFKDSSLPHPLPEGKVLKDLPVRMRGACISQGCRGVAHQRLPEPLQLVLQPLS